MATDPVIQEQVDNLLAYGAVLPDLQQLADANESSPGFRWLLNIAKRATGLIDCATERASELSDMWSAGHARQAAKGLGEVLDTLIHFGPAALPAIERMLNEQDEHVVRCATDALIEIGSAGETSADTDQAVWLAAASVPASKIRDATDIETARAGVLDLCDLLTSGGSAGLVPLTPDPLPAIRKWLTYQDAGFADAVLWLLGLIAHGWDNPYLRVAPGDDRATARKRADYSDTINALMSAVRNSRHPSP